MLWTVDSIPRQNGRIALVTGANSGLGLETARVLAEKGALVILGCRSLKAAKRTRRQLLSEVVPANIDILKIDLSDLSQLNSATYQLFDNYPKLDLLINNAGVMAPPLTLSRQGLELQFAVNHLSHMALTLRLLPLMARQSAGRVVTVSSGAQYMGTINWRDLQGRENYDRWSSYSQSKLANVMFSLELHKRLKESSVDIASLSAHPGLARTNLQSTSIASSRAWQEEFVYKLINPMFQSPRMGSLPQLRAATDLAAQSGEQYGPRFNFRGYPKLCPAARLALNSQARERLWVISEELIGNLVEISEGKKILNTQN